MMNASSQRIRRVIVPPLVRGKPGLESDDRLGAGAIDLGFQHRSDVPDREQILAGEELQDGVNEPISIRFGAWGIRRLHAREV